MAFQGKKTRKTTEPKKQKHADLSFISAKNLIITDGAHTSHFIRLGYKYCPPMISGTGSRFKLDEVLIDMGRWPFVIEMYEVISSLDKTNRSKINNFNALTYLVNICDQNSVEDIFCEESIGLFVAALKNRYVEENIIGKTLQVTQTGIKSIIRELGLHNIKELEKIFYPFPNDSSAIVPYSDDEVNIIVKNLYVTLSTYRKCFLEGRVPDKHPLYDEANLKVTNESRRFVRSAWAKKISTGNNTDSWKLDMVRSAYYLMCFFTGINHGPLSSLKIRDLKDAKFTETSRGKYLLKTTKSRQMGRQNIDEVGFNRRSIEFFESWVSIAKILDPSEGAYLFPKIVNGKCYGMSGATMSSGINHSFKALGLPLLSNKKFRATKSSLIIRATDSVLSAAEGLNNMPSTVNRHYVNGNPIQIKMSLSAMLDVRQRTANGELLKDAKESSVFGYIDPVRQSTYAKNDSSIPTLSPIGMRCKSPFGEKAQSLKKTLVEAGLAGEKDTVACHKFLDCFGCVNHAIIAEVEDIWLMMSFRDVLLEVMSRPSINSMPGDQLVKVACTIESILLRVKAEHKDVYDNALNRHMEAPHPLWSSAEDFDLLRDFW